MLEYLKIYNDQFQSNPLYLEELQHINVICGKNNSGKTTLLRSIINDDRSYGYKVTNELIDSYYELTVGDLGWPHDLHLYEEYKKHVTSVLKKFGVVYTDMVESFGEDLKESIRLNADIGGYGIIPRKASQSLQNMFPDKIDTILIPPKRNMHGTLPITSSLNSDPNGENLIRDLFELQNQTPNSPDSKLYDDLLDAFKSISDGVSFYIESESNHIKLKFSYDEEDWIDATDIGLGLQDLIIILYYAISGKDKLILIEEPENHIHPGMQRKLLHFLSKIENNQFIITTHSNIFLDKVYVNKMFLCKYTDGIMIENATKQVKAMSDLGYSISDNITSDIIVLVEGPYDKPIIVEFLIKYGIYDKYNVGIWPLGGDIMDQLDLELFQQHYQLYAIVDSDPGSKTIRNKFIKKCKELNIPHKQLERYAIENYFSLRVLREVFKGQIPKKLKELDYNTKLSDQLQIDVKKNNRKLSAKMTLEEIKDTDLESVFDEIIELLEE